MGVPQIGDDLWSHQIHPDKEAISEECSLKELALDKNRKGPQIFNFEVKFWRREKRAFRVHPSPTKGHPQKTVVWGGAGGLWPKIKCRIQNLRLKLVPYFGSRHLYLERGETGRKGHTCFIFNFGKIICFIEKLLFGEKFCYNNNNNNNNNNNINTRVIQT